jgi:S1-C subfamily serine protease
MKMSALQELQEAVERVAEQVGPAVVGVGRLGTGIVIGDGAVLTNAHNLRREQVTVTLADGRRVDGAIAGVDADRDLAIVTADGAEAAAQLEWATAPPPLGTAVFGLANPGGGGLRVGFGLVSASGLGFRGPRGRMISPTIEHDAPLPRGSSGGPLVDADGVLLGINTVRLDGGLIAAIGADEALRSRAESLVRGESPRRVRLGVALAPARVARRMRRAVGLPEREGLLVQHVEDGSPADRAGLARGDLLVAANGRPLGRLDDLFEELDGAGTSLGLGVVRANDEREVAVTLDES